MICIVRMELGSVAGLQEKELRGTRGSLGGYLWPVLFLLVDYAAVVLTEVEAYFAHLLVSGAELPIFRSYVFLWIPLVFILFLGSNKVYSRMYPIIRTIQDVCWGVLYGLLASLLVLYFFRPELLVSRGSVVAFALFAFVNILLLRTGARLFLRRFHLFQEPVIMVGAGYTAEMLLRALQGDPGFRYFLLGFVDDHPKSAKLARRYPILGDFAHVADVVKKYQVRTVIITAPGLPRERLTHLVGAIQPYVRYVNIVPDTIGTPMGSLTVDTFFSEKCMMLKIRNNLARRRNRVLKRCFDLVLTVTGGLLISPLLLVIAVLVGIDNHGRIIFAHKRVGKDGKMFKCYKFQTMVPDAAERLKVYLAENPSARKEWEETFKLSHDPRVTKLGGVLRKTSLDEFPQLWNVIRGDMSLVGPRPIVEKEVPRYGHRIREYYTVRPGITGYWQTCGRSDTTYAERVDMDTWYVRNWSVWLDIVYLVKTFSAVISEKGAY